ncbi:type VI secretion system membrane subunit TssM [Aureimonas pseudogalii]|uniref:Type VI secretion system protein ImpL n=1 Tax=Aureimonas pseudogalii TaxID=1744844 RepID=A0A7W6MM42_9HYPH|nr:type VI secretion system membrane subunit TssM [Aureimonas pseudogalii]MBB4000420.1 type VI secretion system protein ImpL [Aureimonas pseudogalii]
MSRSSSRGRMRHLVTHPLTWMSAAALIVAALVWFGGPLLAFGDVRPLGDTTPRLALLLTIALAWGIAAVLLGWRKGAHDQRLVSALRQQEAETNAGANQHRSEVERRLTVIRRKTDETLARLGRDGGRGRIGRRAFRLPWYLVIGPTASGKTALLLNADLSMPFGPPQGAGGPTDDVDFVFTENAVFLDLAGRLTGSGSEPADGQVWLRLLDLVRRLRRRQPACGIVLVVDASSFAEMGEEARRSLAKTLRRRLDEVGERLLARPPVYLVFSKLDRLLGFSTFFETTDRSEREAVWGMPFLASEDEREFAPAERFRTRFGDLARWAAEWRLPRLQEEPDARRRALVYEFPEQFAALGDLVAPFIQILAVPHRFDRPPYLRSISFASARQGGSAMDLVGLAAGESFAAPSGLPRPGEPDPSLSRPFFVREFLAALAPRDALRSGLSTTARRVTQSWQMAAAACLGLLALGLSAHWISRHQAASAYAAAIESDAAAMQDRLSSSRFGSRLPPFIDVLPILNGLRILEGREPGEDLGRIAEVPALQSAAGDAYTAGLNRLFVPYLTEGLQATLADEATSVPDLYQGLKLYLALSGERPLDTLDLPRSGAWLARRWLAGSSDADRVAFAAHVAALGTHVVAVSPVQASLVVDARRRIAAYTLAQLALDVARARPEIEALSPWRPSDHAGAAGPLALARLDGGSMWDGLPGFATAGAFDRASLPALRAAAAEIQGDAWVLGSSEGRASSDVFEGTLGLFSAETIRLWDGLLSDLTVRPMPTAADGAKLLSLLVTTPSPVADLLSAIAKETDLSPPAIPPAAADAIAAAVAPAATTLGIGAPADPGRVVTAAFAPLRRATAASEGNASQVAGVLAAFEPLYRQLNHIAEGGNVLELGTEPQTVSAQIDLLVAALPPSLQPFFKRVQTAAMDLIQGASGERLREVWNTTVLPACQAATLNRFPFSARASEDTPFEDFKSVFGPRGQIAAFREAYLKPLIDTSARPWTWRAGRPEDLSLDAAALRAFEQSDGITQAFFPGGDGPASRFALLPISLDPQAQVARFDVGGQTLRFAHGPAVPLSAQWPPALSNAPAALTMTPEIDGGTNMAMGEGPWALFRLMNQAASRRLVDGNALLASFSLAGRAFTLKLTPASTRNPFELKLLDNYRCPQL